MSETGQIESKTQYPVTPAGRQQYWSIEIESAKDNVKDWWGDGEKVLKEYLGESTEAGRYRLNLFYSDTTTRSANMSGIPKVRARRRFADASDDVARVSAEILERLLNSDIDREEDGYRSSLSLARGDWELPGLGVTRYRYVMESEPTPEVPAKIGACPMCGGAGCPECGGTGQVEMAPTVPAGERKTFEDVETDYVNWKDFLWSPCRTWSECRWVAFRTEMTRDELVARFGEEKGKRVPLIKRTPESAEGLSDEIKDAWSRAEVWEVWDKSSGTRFMWSDGMSEILEETKDPLGLPGFFPCPRPMIANVTSSKFIPRPFYFLAESLYEEAHELTRRIRYLVKAIKCVGGYNASMPELKRMLDDACENVLIPVERWSLVKEKGGLSNEMELLPIDHQIQAVVQLIAQRNVVKQDIYEVTGQSDIMRGQANSGATATEQRIKARFGSSRIQAMQEEYARFASEGQRIRAFLISKMFDVETIVKRSNIMPREQEQEAPPPPMPGMPPAPPETNDDDPSPELVLKAVELLKSDMSAYRIEVDSESLSMTDFDAIQQESVTFMTATAQFFQQWTPLIQGGGPPIAKFALELYQQFASQLRGSERFEDIIDRAVDEIEQMVSSPKPPPPPDPKMQATMVKAQVDTAKAKMDLQASAAEHQMRMGEIKAETTQAAVENQGELIRAAMPRTPSPNEFPLP
jgi:hypothetical protein